MSAESDRIQRVGCAAIPAGVFRDRYLNSLNFLELEGTFYQVPKPSALRKRAREAPAPFAHGLVAWQLISHRPSSAGYRRLKSPLTDQQKTECGWFADTPTVREAVDRVAEACAAIEAETVLFRSPSDFSPSAANRDQLRRFFGELATADRFGTTARVWQADGLWEPETVHRLAAELDLVVATDPLAEDPTGGAPFDPGALPGERGYLRISGLGKSKLAQHELEQLAELALELRQVWFVMATGDAFRDATRLRKLLES